MGRCKWSMSMSQLTMEKALDILDVDKNPNAYRYERRGAIKFLRVKLGVPPKKRFSYWYENETWINGKYFGKRIKCSAVETLFSPSLKDKMTYYNRGTTIVKCLNMVIRDKWNNNRLIYEGTNYNEFMEVAKNYANEC